MTTYYLAQLGFALSVVKNRHIKRRRLLKKKMEASRNDVKLRSADDAEVKMKLD